MHNFPGARVGFSTRPPTVHFVWTSHGFRWFHVSARFGTPVANGYRDAHHLHNCHKLDAIWRRKAGLKSGTPIAARSASWIECLLGT